MFEFSAFRIEDGAIYIFRINYTPSKIALLFQTMLGEKTMFSSTQNKLSDPTKIDLSAKGLTDDDIASALSRLYHNRYITSIYLNTNKISAPGFQLFSEALQDNAHVLKIMLSDNKAGPEGARHIATLLQSNQIIRQVSFSYNQIRSEGARYLAEALIDNHAVENIDLNNNQIQDAGILHISRALATNKKLRTLYFAANNITDDGISSLTEALKTNTSIIDLALHMNEITDVGASYLANALRNNQTLSVLHIYRNKIRIQGMIDIVNALEKNSALTYLCLGNTDSKDLGVPDMLGQSLLDTLKTNFTLTEILLPKGISEYYLKRINSCLKRNQEFSETLLQAAANGDLDTLKKAQAQGASLNTRGTWLGDHLNHNHPHYYHTPLHLAASHGHTHIVQYLLEQGVCINCENYLSKTAKELAIENVEIKAVEAISNFEKMTQKPSMSHREEAQHKSAGHRYIKP